MVKLLTFKVGYYNIYIYTIFFSFVFSFFLKLGAAPVHLFKLDIYKGLPYYTIFLYTVIYLVIYMFYFMQIFLINLNGFYTLASHVIVYFILFGVFFLLVNLFNINCVKSFLAYSGILNILIFILITLSFLN